MSDEQERAAVRAMDRAMPAASEPQEYIIEADGTGTLPKGTRERVRLRDYFRPCVLDGLPKAADVLVRKT